MKIKIRLSTLLRQFGDLDSTNEMTEIETATKVTPLECLQQLVLRHPSLQKWLYDEEGDLRPMIFTFVNGEKLLTDDLSKPLRDGDEVFVVLSFAGG
jgi:molybdopterin converting factor small subunit